MTADTTTSEAPELSSDETAPEASDSAPETPDEGESTETHPSRDERRDERTRSRLRTAESERDNLRAAFIPYVRSAIEDAVADRLSSPASLWLIPGLDPLALLDDDLDLDADKITEQVERLLAAAPQFGKEPTTFDGGARGAAATGVTPTWQGLMTQKPA